MSSRSLSTNNKPTLSNHYYNPPSTLPSLPKPQPQLPLQHLNKNGSLPPIPLPSLQPLPPLSIGGIGIGIDNSSGGSDLGQGLLNSGSSTGGSFSTSPISLSNPGLGLAGVGAGAGMSSSSSPSSSRYPLGRTSPAPINTNNNTNMTNGTGIGNSSSSSSYSNSASASASASTQWQPPPRSFSKGLPSIPPVSPISSSFSGTGVGTGGSGVGVGSSSRDFGGPSTAGSGSGIGGSQRRPPEMISTSRIPIPPLPLNGNNHNNSNSNSNGNGNAMASSSSSQSQQQMHAQRKDSEDTDGDDLSSASSSRRTNPLLDLIDSEKRYLSELGLVIKKVAAAWSRTNFPPPPLDRMFRAIEAVFKVNRAFGVKLNEIGPNPSSPKALGDLLMNWIDDLEPAYNRYASSYLTSFDFSPKITSNTVLPGILAEISKSNPPPAPTLEWTLDTFFALPYSRLRYYKKLYARLLRSTKEGKSDHKLLVAACGRLEKLVESAEGRLDMDVNVVEREAMGNKSNGTGNSESTTPTPTTNGNGKPAFESKPLPVAGPPPPIIPAATTLSKSSPSTSSYPDEKSRPWETKPSSKPPSIQEKEKPVEKTWNDDVKEALSNQNQASGTRRVLPPSDPEKEKERVSTASSGRGSSSESHSNSVISPFNSRLVDPGDRTSGASAATAFTPDGSPVRKRSMASVDRSRTPPLTDLELRLDTTKTLDLFTMKPKACRLQMAPPNLTFTRSLRRAADAIIDFTPSCTGLEVTHKRGHVFVLTDLFLICERMSVTEKAQRAEEVLKRDPSRAGDGSPLAAEMWLCYPPLAGRHLTVVKGGMENQLIVTVMGREKFLLNLESREMREETFEDLEKCIDFAAEVARPVPAPPSPKSATSPLVPTPQSGLGIGSGWQPSSFSPSNSPHSSPALTSHPDEFRTGTIPPSSYPSRPASGYTTGSGSSLMAPPPRNASLRSAPSTSSARPPPPPTTGYPSSATGSAFSRTPSPILPHPSQLPNAPQPYGALPPRTSSSGMNPPIGPQYPQQGAPPLPGQPGAFNSSSQPLRSASSASFHRPSPQGGFGPQPPMPPFSNDPSQMHRSRSVDALRPSLVIPAQRINGPPSGQRMRPSTDFDPNDSPPNSPIDTSNTRIDGPAVISAQMKCKVFLKHGHQQWKSLGSARLKLYVQPGNNVKQLVVEADTSQKTMLISTIVLTDGVERVAKTGVAVELSDQGARTGIVYMIQLRNENSAMGLFESLLAGSDRAVSSGR